MSKNIATFNWIPISNEIFKHFFREFGPIEMSILFKIIERTHNYKNKNYTVFNLINKAEDFFCLSKSRLLKALRSLQSAGHIKFEYTPHSTLEIEILLERPSTCYTKIPISILKDIRKAKVTHSAYSLHLFILYKFQLSGYRGEELKTTLSYLAKVINSTPRTVKNSLLLLTRLELLKCTFSAYQSKDPCVITPLFTKAKIATDTSNEASKANDPCQTSIDLVSTNKVEAIAIQQEEVKELVANTHEESKSPLSEIKKDEEAASSKIVTDDQTIKDLIKVLKRHNRDVSDAPLIVKYLQETQVGLNKKPIKSYAAVWEKDLQSGLKLYQFRFGEWKHHKEKEENRAFFSKKPTIIEEITTNELPVAEVQSEKARAAYAPFTDATPKMNNFSNKLNSFSNKMNNFSQKMHFFSNNLRVLNKEIINNHKRGESSDSFNFSEEELKAITEYSKDKRSQKVVPIDAFKERYLQLGVELLKSNRPVTLNNLTELHLINGKNREKTSEAVSSRSTWS